MVATTEHCAYCFDWLLAGVGGDGSVALQPVAPLSAGTSVTGSYPLFVTWKKRHQNTYTGTVEWRLRGCIGTFSAKELSRGLKEYAIISALRDTRFSPVRPDEIPDLSVDVSLLVNFEYDLKHDDWTVGTHGISIEFVDNASGRTYSATYLPEVAVEQGWTQSRTIEEV